MDGSAGGRGKAESCGSSPPRHLKGDCEVLDRDFSPGFPHHVEDHGPSHHFTPITTTSKATSATAE